MMREVWETAEALQRLGYTTRMSRKGNLRIYRDGIRVGIIRIPRER